MSGKASYLKVTSLIVKEKIFSTRMLLMFPILLLFIPGMAWGFSDPDIILPGGHSPETPMEVLFYSSLGIVFGGTMWHFYCSNYSCNCFGANLSIYYSL
jgi:hypothetical protein